MIVFRLAEYVWGFFFHLYIRAVGREIFELHAELQGLSSVRPTTYLHLKFASSNLSACSILQLNTSFCRVKYPREALFWSPLSFVFIYLFLFFFFLFFFFFFFFSFPLPPPPPPPKVASMMVILCLMWLCAVLNLLMDEMWESKAQSITHCHVSLYTHTLLQYVSMKLGCIVKGTKTHVCYLTLVTTVFTHKYQTHECRSQDNRVNTAPLGPEPNCYLRVWLVQGLATGQSALFTVSFIPSVHWALSPSIWHPVYLTLHSDLLA